MEIPSQPDLHAYAVQIDFFTGDHHYATDIWTVDANDGHEAERLALIQAEASAYVDPRIPQCWGHACARPLGSDGRA